MAPEVWACAVDVRVDSLPDTSFESFREKANEHPGFPEWCGEEGRVQSINLPPEDGNLEGNTHRFNSWRNAGASTWRGILYLPNLRHRNRWGADSRTMGIHPLPMVGRLPVVNEAQTPASLAMGPRVTDFICDTSDPYHRVPGWQVGDGVEDCYNGEDENPDASSDEPGDPAGSTDLESMFEALDASNLQKTMEAFSERLEILLQDNVPDEPKYDIEDLCATMLWDPSDVRVLGVALVLEGGLLLGPQIENSMPHPTTTINVQFLSGLGTRSLAHPANPRSMRWLRPPSTTWQSSTRFSDRTTCLTWTQPTATGTEPWTSSTPTTTMTESRTGRTQSQSHWNRRPGHPASRPMDSWLRSR